MKITAWPQLDENQAVDTMIMSCPNEKEFLGKGEKKPHTKSKEGSNNILNHSSELWMGLWASQGVEEGVM